MKTYKGEQWDYTYDKETETIIFQGYKNPEDKEPETTIEIPKTEFDEICNNIEDEDWEEPEEEDDLDEDDQ